MELDVDICICPSIWNKFHGPAAPRFSVHFLFQTSFSENIIHFHQPPYCSGQKSLRHTINCCFHLCPLAFLLLLLRKSILLWTCCGNSFILQLLRRCGAAPWGWPMVLTCVSTAVQTASGFSCFLIITVNRSRQLFSLLLKSIQQCTRAIQWPVTDNRID